ncbi:acyl-CoA dehydrogenase family protein [Streptosporangium sp. NPDC001681]|uniref:acyl-CoA dehydrogenase family protein n=1 Tax=Streptosporangium sp. NPDC001681 TaxID=3154395 RepID=UPI003321148C
MRDLAARLAADRYAPRAGEWDEAAPPLPVEERRRLAKLGLLGLSLPPATRNAPTTAAPTTAAPSPA